ncbi:MAG TPA: DNA translocase FtsK 4TM domain-containing protein, partial [Armatimonadota bacterium]|nr:DNA translocase FtsK 4TM domain-containing protein [Armatimonadota bacterium]
MARSRRLPPPQPPDHLHRDLIAVGLATLGALVLVSLLLSRGAQAYFIRYVSEGLLLAFGYGAYLIAAVCLAVAAYYFLEKQPFGDRRVLGGTGLLFLVVITLMPLPTIPTPQLFTEYYVTNSGGYLGAGMAFALYRVLGHAGAYVVLLGAIIAAILLITQVTARELARSLGRAARWVRGWLNAAALTDPPARSRRGLREAAEATKRRKRAVVAPAGEEPRVDLREGEGGSAQTAAPRKRKAPQAEPSAPEIPTEPAPAEQLELEPLLAAPPARVRHEAGPYQPPPLSMLKEFEEDANRQEMREETAERIITLEDTLDSFGIAAKVTHYERGPVLTRYEVEPERGIRVAKITSLADDLAMSLAAVDVRVEAPIPGKSAIGIEVPNEHRSMVSMRGVLESPEFNRHRREDLPLALGRDIAGQPVVADLVAMPHLLIAGATGSGKSVCLHTVILSLAMMHSPAEVRLMVIDPKRVEMAVYDGIPHLISPVVHSVKQAADVMRKGIKEMEKRYDRFALKGVTNLSEYNERARFYQDDEIERFDPMPRWVIIIDELADLMMQAKAEFEYSICRLAQLARATGIHLVIATQRPSVKIITGNIKANRPSRISLAVASIHDSRTILDGLGAERLIGHGDMLYAPIDAPKPKRIQGSFVPREDLSKVAEHLRNQGEPDFQIVPELPEGEDDFGGE